MRRCRFLHDRGHGPRPWAGERWHDRGEGLPISFVERPSHHRPHEHREECEESQGRARAAGQHTAEHQRGHERHQEGRPRAAQPLPGPVHAHRTELAEAQRGHDAIGADRGNRSPHGSQPRHQGEAQHEVGGDAEGRVHQVEGGPPQEQHVLGEPGVAADRMRHDEQAQDHGPALEAGTEQGKPERRADRESGRDEERSRQHPSCEVAEDRALLVAAALPLGGRESVQEGSLGREAHLAREPGQLGRSAVHAQRREIEAGRAAHERPQDQQVQPLHREVDEPGGGRDHREGEESRRVRLARNRARRLGGATPKRPACQEPGSAGRGGEAHHRGEHRRVDRPHDCRETEPHEGDERCDLGDALEQAAGQRVVPHDAQTARSAVRDPIEGDRGQRQQHRALGGHEIGRLVRGSEPPQNEPADAGHDGARAQSRSQRDAEDRARARGISLGPAAGHESGRALVEPERAHLAGEVGRGPGQEVAAESRLSEQPRDQRREEGPEPSHEDGQDVGRDPAQQRRRCAGCPFAVGAAHRERGRVEEGAGDHLAHRCQSPLTRPTGRPQRRATRSLPVLVLARAACDAAPTGAARPASRRGP